MSDDLKRKLDDIGSDISSDVATDIKKDIEREKALADALSMDSVEVPVEIPGVELYEQEVSNVPVGVSRGSSPAESISSQGYNPNGNSSTSWSTGQPQSSALKNPGMPTNYEDSSSSAGNTSSGGRSDKSDGVPSSDTGYDDSYGGNGYGPNRRQNSRNQAKDEQSGADGDNSAGGAQKKGKTGAEEQPQNTGTGEAETKKGSDLDKPSDDAVDRAATNAMASQNPNQGQQPESEKKTADDKKASEKKEDEDKRDDSDVGNGYGALKRNKNNQPDQSDATARDRRNFEHNNRVNNSDGEKSSTPRKAASSSSSKSGSPIKDALAKAGNNLKNKAKGLAKKQKDSSSSGQDVVDKAGKKAAGALKNALLLFMKRHPVLSIGIILVLLLLIVFMIETMEYNSNGKGRGKRSCTYNLSGVTGTGTVELSNLKVEVINCDGKADNYEVLATVDFEKYVLGVALAEAGPSSPDEALKAQIIAVRNFTLTRNRGMCPGNPSNCFYGYNESTGIIRMRACTNDQVYWDYTRDCPKIDRAGKPTLYCEGVDGSTTIWKKALSEQRIEEVEDLANSVMGEVLLDENGDVLKLGYKAAETDKFIADAQAGKSYVEILDAVYGSSSYSSARCVYGGAYDYGDYELTSEGDPILHQPLDQFLQSQGTSLEEYNELIAENVDDAGYGTRAGVVAGSVTMVAELGNNYDVKVPYYWGGGHSNNDLTGEALAKWGSTKCHTFANNQHYNYCGLDCSGFVAWALNVGGFKCGPTGAGSFYKKNGAQKVNLNPNSPVLQPGDILEYKNATGGHAILVVGIDEDTKEYICIEAMGNAHGVLFTRRSFGLSGYWGVDMEDFYNNPSNLREPRE